MITLKGLILSDKNRGESSKFISVLTAEKGVIDIFVRGGQKSSKTIGGTQLFSYSKLCVEEKVNSKGHTDYYLNSCESIKIFFNIRLEPKKIALCTYFSQILLYCRTQNQKCDEVLRLCLNIFSFLNDNKRDTELLKSIFELRLLCEIGLMPDLLACHECFCYEADEMLFSFRENNLICKNCFEENQIESNNNYLSLDKTLLYIVRFIALTEYERLFSFKISDKYQKKLTEFTEKYAENILERKFPALKFYRML